MGSAWPQSEMQSVWWHRRSFDQYIVVIVGDLGLSGRTILIKVMGEDSTTDTARTLEDLV